MNRSKLEEMKRLVVGEALGITSRPDDGDEGEPPETDELADIHADLDVMHAVLPLLKKLNASVQKQKLLKTIEAYVDDLEDESVRLHRKLRKR